MFCSAWLEYLSISITDKWIISSLESSILVSSEKTHFSLKSGFKCFISKKRNYYFCSKPCFSLPLLKFVPVSLKLVSFDVYHDFRVSKELRCGDYTNQVGSNFLLKMDFCLLVLLLVLPAFWTSMCGCLDCPTFCLQSLWIETWGVQTNMYKLPACSSVILLCFPQLSLVSVVTHNGSYKKVSWSKNNLGSKVSFFLLTSLFRYKRFHRWHCTCW